MTPVPQERFKLQSGEEYLTLYQFNTKVAKHYFCKICGIYPFHRMRRDPNQYGVNVGCLDGVDPYSLDVGLINGHSFSTVDAI